MIRSWVIVLSRSRSSEPTPRACPECRVGRGTLIDGTGKNLINNAVVVVEGGRSRPSVQRTVTVPAGATSLRQTAEPSCPD